MTKYHFFCHMINPSKLKGSHNMEYLFVYGPFLLGRFLKRLNLLV